MIDKELIKNNPNIQFFSVQDNDLSTVPFELCDLRRIEILNLTGNRIKSLPDTIGNLKYTAASEPEPRFKFNQLHTLPALIGDLTGWHIYYRENPFEKANPFEAIRHHDVGKNIILGLLPIGSLFANLEDRQWLNLTLRLMNIDENNRRLMRS